jgi:hypothetical protein
MTRATTRATDDRPYPDGNSNDARLQRWIVDNLTKPVHRRIREDGDQAVTMLGGDLYELLYRVTEWAYGKAVIDVRDRHGIT